jgi:anti-sigma-K factor RskA
MRLTPERRDHIAAGYAVGTLGPQARAWVARRLTRDAALCAAVVGWQELLARWVELLAPVAPRAEVWLALEQRLAPAPPVALPPRAPEPIAAPPVPRVAPLEAGRGAAFWRRSAALAAAAAIALAVALGLLLRPAPTPSHTAVFADAQGRPVWIVDARLPEGVLALRALPAAMPPPGKSYELWMLPAGGPPVSLGLLPAAGEVEVALRPGLGARLVTAAGMAVSLEPEGGSPTGLPSGPVVYQASLVRT